MELSSEMVGKRILVVDDEHAITGSLKAYLEAMGMIVMEQNDPKTVLVQAREFLPNLILMDFRMPGMNGAELAIQLLADDMLKFVPIVFMSGSPKEEILEHLPRKNFTILPKPLRMEAILVFLRLQKICPKCGAIATLRAGRNASGSHVRIWSCIRSPACDGWLPFE